MVQSNVYDSVLANNIDNPAAACVSRGVREADSGQCQDGVVRECDCKCLRRVVSQCDLRTRGIIEGKPNATRASRTSSRANCCTLNRDVASERLGYLAAPCRGSACGNGDCAACRTGIKGRLHVRRRAGRRVAGRAAQETQNSNAMAKNSFLIEEMFRNRISRYSRS